MFINKQQRHGSTKLSLVYESRSVISRHRQRTSGCDARPNRILQNVCFLLRETDLQWKSRGFPTFEMARSSEIYFQSGAIEYAFSLKRADARNVRSFSHATGLRAARE